MTTIRVKPEELETVAKHVPDAEDACRRARTSLSWELPSLVMEIPGIGSAAIHELTDELLHWLRHYEEKLNEAEELLYRTAAAIRQADQTLADNMKEFGLELSGWYDLQRVFGEYDPVTGERISGWDRLVAGGMLLASFVPPVKGAGVAGKAAIKGAKAAETAADVSKLVSQTKNVLNYNKIKPFFQTIYHQVIKGPITETIRSFKKQWENFLENVGSVLQGPQLAIDGVGAVPSGRMIGIAEESASSVRISMSQAGDEVVGKGIGKGKNESPRNKPGVVSESFKFDRSLQKQTKLMYNKGAIGIIPKEIRDKLVGKKFNSFDDFRKEFWKCVANSSYAKEFRSRNIARMLEGNAPIAPKAEHYGKLKSYILHHKQPIEKGGEVYNLDNLIITSPRMHQIILDPAYHFGKKG